jgi:hypothetical protein
MVEVSSRAASNAKRRTPAVEKSMLSGEGGDFSLGNAMNRRRSAMVRYLL